MCLNHKPSYVKNDEWRAWLAAKYLNGDRSQRARAYQILVHEGAMTTTEFFDRVAVERPRIGDPKRILTFLAEDGLVRGRQWREGNNEKVWEAVR